LLQKQAGSTVKKRGGSVRSGRRDCNAGVPAQIAGKKRRAWGLRKHLETEAGRADVVGGVGPAPVIALRD